MAKFEVDPYTKAFLMRLVMWALYIIGGAVLFMWIENTDINSSHVGNNSTFMKEIRKNTTNIFNMTHEQFEDLVEKILRSATMKPTKPWKYQDSLMYVMHLLTTIGYGNITPKTEQGQIVTILYAVFGIPLTLLTLRAMGCHYNYLIKKIITAFETKCLRRNQVRDMERKLVIGNVFITILYLFLVAVISIYVDNFTFVQAFYAWFITITTVGFGDFIPIGAITLLVLTGLCLMSGCMDAMVMHAEHEDYSKLRRKLKEKFCCHSLREKVLAIQVAPFPEDSSSNAHVMDLGEKERWKNHPDRLRQQDIRVLKHFEKYHTHNVSYP